MGWLFHQDWSPDAASDPVAAFAWVARGLTPAERGTASSLLDRSLGSMTNSELVGLWRRSGSEIFPTRATVRPFLTMLHAALAASDAPDGRAPEP